jgi:hypothetical protein
MGVIGADPLSTSETDGAVDRQIQWMEFGIARHRLTVWRLAGCLVWSFLRLS